MTDRIHSFTATLEHDIRDDEAEAIKQAISVIRGVISVKANVTEFDLHVAEMRANHKLQRKLLDMFK